MFVDTRHTKHEAKVRCNWCHEFHETELMNLQKTDELRTYAFNVASDMLTDRGEIQS